MATQPAFEDPSGATNEALVSRYRDTGDKSCLAELYTRFGHLVLGLCIKYLGNRMDAEDATAEIFSRLLTDLRHHQVRHFRSWLFVYSKNHCLMELRKRQSALKRELRLADDLPLLMDYSDPAHLHEREQQIRLLEQAIESLNDKQKTCIRLFYLENRSYQEIAAITGFPGGEVKSHIQNGKRNIRIKLETSGDEKRE